MKTIEETFKAEKEILEEFFKDRINFRDKTVLRIVLFFIQIIYLHMMIILEIL